MKKLFIALLSIIVFDACRLQAQSYCPMPDTNAFWKEAILSFFSSNSASTQRDEFLDGDTVIGSYSYTKIYTYGTTTYNPSGNVQTWTHSYVGAMRDDTLNRMVYFIPQYPANAPEYLLYDFNLVVGQVLPFTWQHYQDSMWVTSIDSVYFNSRYHRRYHTGNMGCGDEYQWIEGMGSSYGLTLPFQCPAQLSRMLCFYQNNHPCWPDTASGCASVVSVPEANTFHQLVIEPVPAHHYILVEHPSGHSRASISIFDANGRLVVNKDIYDEAPMEIDLASFAPGIYLLNYYTADGYTESKKFIVE